MIPTPHRDITFHAFDDGGVLHRTGSHRLWVLNVTAATLWCLLDGQTAPPALARAYGARFGLTDAAASADVSKLLATFERWGLLSGGAIEDYDEAPAGDPSARGPAPARATEKIKGLPRETFALRDLFFSIAMADQDLAEQWRMLFRHLGPRPQPGPAAAEFAVLQSQTGNQGLFCGWENGVAAQDGLARNEIFPWLVYRLFAHGMAGLGHRLLFHAAVVAKKGRAVLLPAPSGAGKSTLAAALTAAGWAVLSDELAVIDPQNPSVEAFALPIGLKDKSVAPLAAIIPGLADRPRHVRADGVGLRYFTPPDPPPDGRLPVAALVFPHFRPGTTTRLRAIAPLAALEHLAVTGSSARPLNAEDIAATLGLADRPCYRLHVGDLNEAVAQFERLQT